MITEFGMGLDGWVYSPDEWVMSIVSAMLDESGKFGDREIVTFGGVAAPTGLGRDFSGEWGQCLRDAGLDFLSAKGALNHNRPLSEKVPAAGPKERNQALFPFVMCIRKCLRIVTAVSIDARAFQSLPAHYYQKLGNDPIYTAFLRVFIRLMETTADSDTLNIICDDEECTALPMYKLYRRIKQMPRMREKLAGISFADDEVFVGLQAADLVSSLARLEAGRRFKQRDYEYMELFACLTGKPAPHEAIWNCEIAFIDKECLTKLADDLAN